MALRWTVSRAPESVFAAILDLKLKERGALKEQYFADLVIFDPDSVQDHATFEHPHQYSTGVRDVIVNGVPVLRNGVHTGAMPGRFIKGPGFRETTAQ